MLLSVCLRLQMLFGYVYSERFGCQFLSNRTAVLVYHSTDVS